jgi:hypothetical protein
MRNCFGSKLRDTVMPPPDPGRRRTAREKRLPTVLLDLAAGREPEGVEPDAGLLAVASEHRMTGLLWTWVSRHDADVALKTRLAMNDLRIQAHLVRVWSVLEASTKQLDAVGIEVATIKGVTAESRWYARRGERPCSDVDLWLDPRQLDRASEAVSILQPDHPWVPYLGGLIASGSVQSVTLRVEGLEVDLHFDLLKLGIETRQSEELWARTFEYSLRDGLRVRVLDDTSALLHFLVHLNKDRFQRLIGFADIPRVLASGHVDWVALRRLARNEGIEVAVFRSLSVVLDELELPWPHQAAEQRGPRALVWNLLWRPGIRLRGREGRLRFRGRQNWIALLAHGRTIEAVLWWIHNLWPPAVTVSTRYPEISGPYLWKLLCGRIQAAVTQHNAISDIRGKKGH